MTGSSLTDPGQTPPRPPKTPSLLENWISLFGLIVAACSFFAFILLIAIDFQTGFTTPYLGILTYLVTPAVLTTGLVLGGIGVLVEHRRRQHLAPGEVPRHPRIDLNVRRHRNALMIVTVVSFVFLVTTGLGTYQAYHFTESVSFCGQTCHEVMQPEYVAYQNSAHARVTCVQCHIGPGAGWFVRSKLSGLYQVYATLANVYPQPIPTPIENLRPAQETCEQCHWPRKFFGNAERVNYHFLSDSANQPWTIRLLMKIGGGDPEHGPAGGIHWHMNISNRVDYIHTDSARQVIPWVRVTAPDGGVTVYQSEEDSLTAAQVDSAVPRLMDCMDCHNRPAHTFQAPARAVNVALGTGRLSLELPFIKQTAVGLLTAEYDSTAQALAAIDSSLTAQYGHAAPEQARQAVAEVQRIYRTNFFPEMKVSWRAYPNNLGHTIFPGCYRCHDGKHRSTDGRTITHTCTACHTIMGQGSGAAAETIAPEGIEFTHPVDIGEMWREVNCAVCHTGG
jgi:nitrate/TMAO reductase-like tetraheme cytochrome c subunit